MGQFCARVACAATSIMLAARQGLLSPARGSSKSQRIQTGPLSQLQILGQYVTHCVVSRCLVPTFHRHQNTQRGGGGLTRAQGHLITGQTSRLASLSITPLYRLFSLCPLRFTSTLEHSPTTLRFLSSPHIARRVAAAAPQTSRRISSKLTNAPKAHSPGNALARDALAQLLVCTRILCLCPSCRSASFRGKSLAHVCLPACAAGARFGLV